MTKPRYNEYFNSSPIQNFRLRYNQLLLYTPVACSQYPEGGIELLSRNPGNLSDFRAASFLPGLRSSDCLLSYKTWAKMNFHVGERDSDFICNQATKLNSNGTIADEQLGASGFSKEGSEGF